MILDGSICLPGRGSLPASEVSVTAAPGKSAEPFYFVGKPELVSLIVSAGNESGRGVCLSTLLEEGSPLIVPQSMVSGDEYYGHGLIVRDSRQEEVFLELGVPRLGEEYVRPMRIPHFKPSELNNVEQPGLVML
jgi:hypothetical protein